MFSETVKKRKNSVILSVFFIGAVCYIVFTWVGLQGKIQEQAQTLSIVNENIKVQDYENNELKRILDAGNSSEYFERIARKDLGYVMPDEKVYYYDISTGE